MTSPGILIYRSCFFPGGRGSGSEAQIQGRRSARAAPRRERVMELPLEDTADCTGAREPLAPGLGEFGRIMPEVSWEPSRVGTEPG